MPEKSQKFYYTAYGLSIESEIEFPELFSLHIENQAIDIKISVGKAPQKSEIVGIQKPISAYNSNEYWQEIPNIARYYAKNRNEVIIEPLYDNWNDIRLFGISSVFYAILFQRNSLPIFASGVRNNAGEVVLFMGPRLFGKSTLLYQLMKLGFKPFTDDSFVLAPHDKDSKEFFAFAAYPQLKLWKETFPKLGIKNNENFMPLRPNINKFGYYFHDQFSPLQQKIKAIVVLNETKKVDKIGIKKLNQMEAFLAMHECHPRPEWIDDLKMVKQNFVLLTALSTKISVFSAERPYFDNTCKEFASLIIDTVLN